MGNRRNTCTINMTGSVYSPLVSDHKGTIDHFRRTYSAELPPAELELKLYTYAGNAERTFDKTKNASFKTHLSHHLNKLKRDVHNSGSNLKVSEDVGMSINKLRTSGDEFYMKHGRMPDNRELAKHTGMPEKFVDKYKKMGKIKTVATDKFNGGVNHVSLQSLLPDLTGRDKKIADTITMNMSTPEALKHTGMSNTAYYKGRNKIRSRMRSSYVRLNTQEM